MSKPGKNYCFWIRYVLLKLKYHKRTDGYLQTVSLLKKSS